MAKIPAPLLAGMLMGPSIMAPMASTPWPGPLRPPKKGAVPQDQHKTVRYLRRTGMTLSQLAHIYNTTNTHIREILRAPCEQE